MNLDAATPAQLRAAVAAVFAECADIELDWPLNNRLANVVTGEIVTAIRAAVAAALADDRPAETAHRRDCPCVSCGADRYGERLAADVPDPRDAETVRTAPCGCAWHPYEEGTNGCPRDTEIALLREAHERAEVALGKAQDECERLRTELDDAVRFANERGERLAQPCRCRPVVDAARAWAEYWTPYLDDSHPVTHALIDAVRAFDERTGQ